MMKNGGRQRPTERVEVITGDPQLFRTGAPGSESAKMPIAHRPRVDLIALGVVVLVVVVAIAATWPRSAGSSRATLPTSAASPPSAGSPPATAPGRDAPGPSEIAAFTLVVEPTRVELGTSVVMQLKGDLSGVASPISAVAWVDQQVSGVWRTMYWTARTSDNAQAGGDVTNNYLGPSPDAVTFGADQPLRLNVDALDSGSYRLCRYVPLRSAGTSNLPSLNPAYLCAPLVVDHAVHHETDRTWRG